MTATPLALDPGEYGGTYKLVGGRVSLDFVNTVSYRSSEDPHDWLELPENLLAWAVAVDIVDDGVARFLEGRRAAHPEETDRDLAELRKQRDVVYGALAPVAQGSSPRGPAVDALNGLLAQAVSHRRIDPSTLAWAWEPPRRLREVVRPVILDAANILADSDHRRLGQCPGCDWLFYDSTRNRSRRWCAMADCGSRDKALRYYHRKRQEESGGPPDETSSRERGS